MTFLECCPKIQLHGVDITGKEIVIAAEKANEYLVKLHTLFSEMDFNLFVALGQRNLSGVIGEIFSRFLSGGNDRLENNPHPDGRPDVLCIPNEEVRDYLRSCYITIDDKKIPSRSMLAPFRYGGLEVKCTIGDPVSNYKEKLRLDHGIDGFEIGFSRVDYLQNLNWWAHHTKSTHLLGLYYDFSEAQGGVPQIRAGFFGVLGPNNWTKVSTGNVENKKTSNTSLNKSGREIMKGNPVFVFDDPKYVSAFRRIGVAI